MSADIFFHKEDIYVAMAVPNSDSCIIMEWDHIETKFRPFDNITGLTMLGYRYCSFYILFFKFNIFLITFQDAQSLAAGLF